LVLARHKSPSAETVPVPSTPDRDRRLAQRLGLAPGLGRRLGPALSPTAQVFSELVTSETPEQSGEGP
jgi:hypothetical protein